MRILVVTPTYLKEDGIVGGAEQFVHSISKELIKQPSVSEIIVQFFSESKNSKTFDQGVLRYGSKTFFILNNPSNPFPALSSLFFLGYDILYLHQFNTWLTLFYTVIAKVFGKKVILTDHNGGGLNYNKHFKIQNLIDINFHTSNISKEDTAFNIKKNIRIFGGVNSNLYKPSASVIRDKDFLFVGRLHPVKGIDHLIEASKNCTTKHTLTLILSCKNKQKQKKLENEIKELEQIKILWNPPRDEIIKEYSAHNWVVLPSKNSGGRENLGLTILEGMSCDAQAACSPYCGVGEMKEVYPTDHLLIVDNWNEFFNQKAQSKTYQPGARDWVLANGTWSSVAKRIVAGINE